MPFSENQNHQIIHYGNTKMSKYLIYTDAHAKGVNPKSRTDNYYQSWLTKYREVFSIAKENKVRAIIDGGDLLDIPNVADSIVDDILDIIEEFQIPVWALWGNHNQIGHNTENSKNTSFSHMLRRCKLLRELQEFGTDNYIIKGFEYYHTVEEDIKKEGIFFEPALDIYKESFKQAWKIAICHVMITPTPFFKDAAYIVPEDIETNADLIVCGHFHHPWQKKVGNTQFVNPGCFGRTSISMYDIEPSVVLLDTEKRSWELIKLTSAKKGTEVFDLSKKETLENNERELEEFISQLKNFKAQEMDLVSVINQICKDNAIDIKVRDIILNKLGEVK